MNNNNMSNININYKYNKTDILKLKKEEKKTECKHCFIVDYIDINPERSEQIIYCKKCLLCK
jgi:hypothetical protein